MRVAAALTAIAGAAALVPGPASTEGERVRVWGAAGSEVTVGSNLVDVLARAPKIAAPRAEPFYILQIDVPGHGGSVPVVYAPSARAVAGNADGPGLVWLRLDSAAAAWLAAAAEKLRPYEDGGWARGLKAGPLRDELEAAGGGR
jgi:hypothetical protein